MKRIFLDMDGVLANWEKSVTEVLGRDSAVRDFTWEELLEAAPRLYADLELMPSAVRLWDYVRNSSGVSSVKILTAIPRRIHWPDCTSHKREWVWKHFGSDVDVLFGPFAWDKQFHCKGIDDILIDDSELNIPQWRQRGGLGILHTSVDDTIDVLKMLGV